MRSEKMRKKEKEQSESYQERKADKKIERERKLVTECDGVL